MINNKFNPYGLQSGGGSYVNPYLKHLRKCKKKYPLACAYPSDMKKKRECIKQYVRIGDKPKEDDEPKKAPTTTSKKAPVKKAPVSHKDFIINNWSDIPNLYLAMESSDDPAIRNIAVNITKLENTKKYVYDDLIIRSLIYFNNDVIEKHGVEQWLEGVHNIVDSLNNGKKVLIGPIYDGEIKKGSMSEANRKKVFDYFSETKAKSEYGEFKLDPVKMKDDFERLTVKLKEKEKIEKQEELVPIPKSDPNGKILKVTKNDFINALNRRGYDMNPSKPMSYYINTYEDAKQNHGFEDKLLVQALRRRLEQYNKYVTRESSKFDSKKGYRYEIPTKDRSYLFVSKIKS